MLTNNKKSGVCHLHWMRTWNRMMKMNGGNRKNRALVKTNLCAIPRANSQQ